MEIINGVLIVVLSAFILWICSAVYKKYKLKENQALFSVADINPTQKGEHPCILVKFKSNDAVVEFQKRNGKLVGCNNLEGWVRQDCAILHEHLNSWSFKVKKLLRIKLK